MTDVVTVRGISLVAPQSAPPAIGVIVSRIHAGDIVGRMRVCDVAVVAFGGVACIRVRTVRRDDETIGEVAYIPMHRVASIEADE